MKNEKEQTLWLFSLIAKAIDFYIEKRKELNLPFRNPNPFDTEFSNNCMLLKDKDGVIEKIFIDSNENFTFSIANTQMYD